MVDLHRVNAVEFNLFIQVRGEFICNEGTRFYPAEPAFQLLPTTYLRFGFVFGGLSRFSDGIWPAFTHLRHVSFKLNVNKSY